jgi:hypothetical protein
MGAAAVPLMVAGGITSAYSQYQEGKAQNDYYKYLAANKRTEANLVRQQGTQAATMAEGQGSIEATTARRKENELIGSQKAASGANVGGGSVTSADILSDTLDKAKMDQLAIKYNADNVAWKAENDAKTQAWALENEATGYETAGKQAKFSGKIGAFNSLLGSAGQVAGYNYRKSPYQKKSNGRYQLGDF